MPINNYTIKGAKNLSQNITHIHICIEVSMVKKKKIIIIKNNNKKNPAQAHTTPSSNQLTFQKLVSISIIWVLT